MIARLSALLPRSIAAQISGLIAISTLLTITALTVILFFVLGLPPNRNEPVLTHIAEVTRLLQHAEDSGQAESLLAVLRRSDSAIRRIPISQLVPRPDEHSSFMATRTLQQLEQRTGIDVLADQRDPFGQSSQIVTRLNRTDALVFVAELDTSFWPMLLTPAAPATILVVVSIVVLSIYAVRWMVAPLAAVAKAAVSFGRSPQDFKPLERTGPYEIIQVTDALNEMQTRICALLADRTRMLAAISHDLRTPLTRLRLRTERVTNEALREAMLGDIINVSLLIDETLEYLRSDVRSERPTRIDLPSFLKTICFDFSDMGHSVSYQGPSRMPFECRPHALSRAVTNIVENAVKHGSSNVIVSLAGSTDGQVEVEVADDGPGIPSSLRDRVFEPFFKADEARPSTHGFGLGLSIAKDIITRHGGAIELKPSYPTGLRVVMTIQAG